MLETNEEITQKLKQSIHDYYMSHVKQKLNFLLVNGKESEISNQIMQFLDAQIDTGNSLIVKDDIIRILNSVLLEDSFGDNTALETRISHCFPNVADITIDQAQAVYLAEKLQTPFNGTIESSYYLYVAPEYYDKNIQDIENEIRKIEKTFSRQDIKGFEQKFNEDLGTKQYELESAKVYESASNQIELKKQKFNFANQKTLNEYGKKYEEILEKDISEEEKFNLAKTLLDETKSADEKNRQAVLRLNTEYEKLSENFKGKVQDVKTISCQMQNLHLFDKNRYFEDMRASINPTLRDLYKKRYLLNSYRQTHNEPIFTGKPNIFSNIFENILQRGGKIPLALGPHFERDYETNTTSINSEEIDKNLIKALAHYYGNAIIGDVSDFENSLVEYFKTNYKELTGDKSSDFLTKFSQNASEGKTEGDLFKVARHFEIDTEPFKNNYGADLIVKDDLIYEENENGLNVIYATDKAINNKIDGLYSTALYYKHLARENALSSIKSIALQNAFVDYAKQNNITLENYEYNQNLQQQKRFIKKKEEQENIVDFKKSC